MNGTTPCLSWLTSTTESRGQSMWEDAWAPGLAPLQNMVEVFLVLLLNVKHFHIKPYSNCFSTFVGKCRSFILLSFDLRLSTHQPRYWPLLQVDILSWQFFFESSSAFDGIIFIGYIYPSCSIFIWTVINNSAHSAWEEIIIEWHTVPNSSII